MGMPCVAGAETPRGSTTRARAMRAGGTVVNEGDEISHRRHDRRGLRRRAADDRGANFEDEHDLADAARLGGRARRLEVWANADYPRDAEQRASIRRAGHRPLPHRAHVLRGRSACRSCRRMILADQRREERGGRELAQAACRSSASDFEGIFRAMDGLPVVIRLIDPPLHEFLPQPRRADQRDDAAANATRRERRQPSSTRREAAAGGRGDARGTTRCSACAACRLGLI